MWFQKLNVECVMLYWPLLAVSKHYMMLLLLKIITKHISVSKVNYFINPPCPLCVLEATSWLAQCLPGFEQDRTSKWHVSKLRSNNKYQIVGQRLPQSSCLILLSVVELLSSTISTQCKIKIKNEKFDGEDIWQTKYKIPTPSIF